MQSRRGSAAVRQRPGGGSQPFRWGGGRDDEDLREVGRLPPLPRSAAVRPVACREEEEEDGAAACRWPGAALAAGPAFAGTAGPVAPGRDRRSWGGERGSPRGRAWGRRGRLCGLGPPLRSLPGCGALPSGTAAGLCAAAVPRCWQPRLAGGGEPVSSAGGFGFGGVECLLSSSRADFFKGYKTLDLIQLFVCLLV